MDEWSWLEGLGVKSVKVSKVSQILEITTNIASVDKNEAGVKSVKRVQIVSLRRWQNEDGWETRGGGEIKCVKVS